ncbi:Proprotein convertase subtilisin/kexin type 5 [Dissostichus eleginoides]|uniref:Proprotein convertase subtilisin/kexin type 5 n=1 Tax=Dissostichus eleginoides TaxID=100907 RepID=A0AAD9BIP6_DISEL|nr:Proprotein convertase subtilisin/kexin type 5 [Dissostichus eleginoides]
MVHFLFLWMMGALLQVCHATIYTNDWAIRIRGDRECVSRIAEKYGFTNMGQIGDLKSFYSFRHSETAMRSTVSNTQVSVSVATETEVEWLQQQVVLRREKRNSRANHVFSVNLKSENLPTAHPSNQTLHNDSMWRNPWYHSGMNIVGAWRRGFSGKGVVVSVLDDGIEREHPDLKPNYDPLASRDVNGQDDDPSPNYSNAAASNYHGTQSAGTIAAAAHNSHCTVGVSFHARIGGIRMLDGDVTDMVEAQSLSFRPQYIDIYSASWGPEDDGATLEGPGPLTRLALENGIKNGRRGRGSVFVWSSGSGGLRGDHCSCDGYSSSIYTVSISSSRSEHLEHLEPCTSTLAAAHPGGEGMVTLGPQKSCSRTTADSSLHLYGFGLLDAEAMVLEAQRWRRVPAQRRCVQEDPQISRAIFPRSVLTSVFQSSGCSSRVVFVEHVVVRLSIDHRRRGDLSITLTSPSGTESKLLNNRPFDDSTEGFPAWELMTTHSWGEPAAGGWTLKIRDSSSERREKPGFTGRLKEISLVIFGTSGPPYPRHRVRSAETPMDSDLTEEYSRPCDPECNADGCEGPGPQQCVTCSHFFLKFKNSTRMCVSDCPRGFWGDRRRCKRCFSSCESCTGSRGDQCTSCLPKHHLTEETNTCSASCGEKYYLDHDANVCRKCSESCLKCTSSSVCTECKPDTSLQGNRCQQSCSVGFFHDEQEGTCRACDEACATCAGAGVALCSSCADGHLMEEWRCVSSCSDGFYAEVAAGNRVCRRCDASCLTCSGPSGGECSSCSSGHRLQHGACVLNTACADGEFLDADGMCAACDATCLRCTGPRTDDCISCSAARALEEGRCVVQCAKGKYRSGGRCHLCDHTCSTCVEAGPQNCTSCDTDKFRVQRYLYGGVCVDACPEAFFHSEISCESCSTHCLLCSSSTRCLHCDSSYYVSDGACSKPECGEGEVEDPDYDDCMSCEEGCNKCVLYNPKHCLSCTEGFYNFQDGCYKNCPAKTYSVDAEMSCVPCEENCVSCDEHECYWCETDLFLSEGICVPECPMVPTETRTPMTENDCLSCEDGKLLEDGECVSDHELCPVKTFRSDDGACEDCHPSCESCSGEEKTRCTTCAKGRFLTAQQTCVSKCPGGFFSNRVSGVCEACPPGCVQCEDALICKRCQSSRFLQDGGCVKQCVRGYPAGGVCRSCVSGCVSCVKNATHCLSCEEPLLLHKHQCVRACPAEHTVRDRECTHCPPACLQCDPLGRCTDCEDYHFLHEGLCVPDCPEKFFEATDQRECVRCHPDCALCDGPNNNDCDACTDPGASLHSGACLTACPSHTSRDTVTEECKDCDASCLTCSGPLAGSCSSCRQGERLEGERLEGHCLPANHCSPHQYTDLGGGCHLCHKYCLRCSGPGKSHCLSCNQRHLLLNGTCVDKCPVGHYEHESGQKCEPCHPSCQSCVGKHNHECLACKTHLFREGKECVETCQQHSHYGNTGSRMCEKCDPSCGECIGGGEDECLSCPPDLIYLRRDGRCLASCPLRYYQDEEHRSCEACHASCRTCSDGRCESMCDVGLFPVMKDSGHVCVDCDGSCLECRGPGPANCSMCPPQAILETRGECVLSTNLAFRNKEEEVSGGNLTIFIITCFLLVFGLVAVVFIIRHSRSKRAPPDITPRGYEKLGSGGGFGGGGIGFSSSSSSARPFPLLLADASRTLSWWTKFRYGQLDEDNEDELEYDDESYTFR